MFTSHLIQGEKEENQLMPQNLENFCSYYNIFRDKTNNMSSNFSLYSRNQIDCSTQDFKRLK